MVNSYWRAFTISLHVLSKECRKGGGGKKNNIQCCILKSVGDSIGRCLYGSLSVEIGILLKSQTM